MITLDKKYIKAILRKRDSASHKGDYGHALIIAGSKGKIGAAVLVSRACLRSGAGLLTCHVPQCGISVIQQCIPEAMVVADKNENCFSETLEIDKYNVIGIGPGIGLHETTVKGFGDLLEKINQPMVLDADALNILSSHKSWLEKIPENSVLTPHSKEFERLVGKWTNDSQKIELQIEFSKKYKCIVALKGPGTTISNIKGEIYVNSTGNPGMSKGGSGDSLTGMITAFIAQGYTSLESAQLGVYLHGLAGDLAVKEFSEYALLSSDLIEFIPKAFLQLQSN